MRPLTFIQLTALLLVSCLIQSCNQDSAPPSNAKVPTFEEEEFGNIPQQVTDSLRKWGPSVQRFTIEAGKQAVIKAKGGTKVMVWPESLMDANGNPFVGEATLTIKEHLDLQDAFLGNLQTVSGDKLLQTHGMIYVQITDKKGNSLSINPENPIRIEIPAKDWKGNAKLFSGRRDSLGNIDWQVSAEKSKQLIPFPIRMLTMGIWGECPPNFGISNDSTGKAHFSSYYIFDDIKKYENTLLATREFLPRYYSLCMPEVTKIYIEHCKGPMWVADEAMVKYLIQDSIERMTYASRLPVGIHGGPPTKEQLHAHQWLYDHDLEFCKRNLETYRAFAKQRLGNVDPSRLVSDSLIAQSGTAFAAYDALKLGWINVDAFFDDPNAIVAKVESEFTGGELSTVKLVLPGRKMCLAAKSVSGNHYAFTDGSGPYSKLPAGEKAAVLAIGLHEGRVVFGMAEFVISGDVTTKVDMQPLTSQEIQAKLATLQPKYRQSM